MMSAYRESPCMKRKVLEDYLSCNLCSDVFTEIADLRRHEMEHAGNDVIKVFKGNQNVNEMEKTRNDLIKLFERNQDLDRMKNIRNNEVFKPNYNNTEMDSTWNDVIKVFKRSSNSKIDIQSFSGEEPRHTDEREESTGYGKKFRNNRTVMMPLAESLTDSLIGGNDYQCTITDTVAHKYCLELQQKFQAIEKPFQCTFCDQSFPSKDSLIFHEKSHDNIPFQCEFCGKVFVQKLSYTNHLRTHTGEWPFECKECEKRFSTLQSLKMHELEHEGGLPYKCDICDKGFRTINALRRHKVIHTHKSPYRGNVEDSDSASNSSNYKNTDQNHFMEGFHCRRCDQAFPTKSKLIEHQISHQDGKIYQCEKCGDKFWRKRRLTRHQMLHCHAAAATRHQALHSHYTIPNVIKLPETTETTEKTFKCDDCGEGFWRRRHLTRHKTFSCKFTYLFNLTESTITNN